MDTRRPASWLLLAGIALAGGCSGDGTDTFPPGSLLCGGGGFCVMYSDPDWNAEHVPVASNIVVTFNQPLRESSLAASVTVTQTNGGKDTPVEGTLTLSNGGSTLIFTHEMPFLPDAKVVMNLSVSLTSTTGEPLRVPTEVVFWTGAMGSMSGRSVPGAPKVRSLYPVSDELGGVCLAFIVEFNEDISRAPTARVDINVPGPGDHTQTLYAYPQYQNGLQSWILTFSSGLASCNCDLFNMFTNVYVKVSGAVDLQGERMREYTKKFDGGLSPDIRAPSACYY